uniref:NADH-ubiquinone oxidoreductase chain 4 n=1 Tax=Alcidodes juglans TaxID=2530216 RepID=A0A482DUU0_9CUCU|nr:NADH dehydrogenase subunit 4 [Alcidodes juglans]QBM10386.1 NADH dehydrogenase subunit 4 [Alcidodes juglans]
MMVIIPLIFLTLMSFLLNFWNMLILLFLMSFIFMFKLVMLSGNIFINLSYYFGIDILSYSLIMLSFWICSLMILASESIYKSNYYNDMFLLMVVSLLLSLVLTFSSMNLFVFYLFFEISLIPVLFLILGWGYQPERIPAGMYLLFYTLLASLPMMVALFYLSKTFYSLDFYFFKNINNLLLYFCVNMVFLVKIPMYMIHLWLPKAHVEAPISGSMILAGVLLKLGGYGLIRTMKIFIEIGMKINFMFIVISLIGGVIVSLMCLRQSDMKMLIAYSSVSHMGLVLAGIMSLNSWGFWGALILMLAHGLCSSGLFCLANISYERTHSRSIYLNKGMLNILPNLSLWWFLLCSFNMAAPPSLNLIGEIMLINSLVAYSKYTMVSLFLMVFLSASYSLFLYSYTQHGQYYSGLYAFNQINIREYLLLFLHWVPLNMLILKLDMFIW